MPSKKASKKKTLRQDTDPRWRSPARPAPGELRIVQAFLGTAPAWKSPEELVDPDALAGWLEQWDLIPRGTELRREHLRRILSVRENLRALVRARNGKAAPKAAKALELEARQAPVCARFDADGGIRYQAQNESFEGALAKIFDAVNTAQRDGSWGRALRRRSHKHNLPWKRFCRLARSRLPQPRITHPYPSQRLRVTT